MSKSKQKRCYYFFVNFYPPDCVFLCPFSHQVLLRGYGILYLDGKDKNIKEEDQSKMENRIKTSSCSICKGGSPSVLLECDHMFHRKCLVEELKKRMECTVCASTNMSGAKIICEQCLSNFFVVNLEQFIMGM